MKQLVITIPQYSHINNPLMLTVLSTCNIHMYMHAMYMYIHVQGSLCRSKAGSNLIPPQLSIAQFDPPSLVQAFPLAHVNDSQIPKMQHVFIAARDPHNLQLDQYSTNTCIPSTCMYIYNVHCTCIMYMYTHVYKTIIPLNTSQSPSYNNNNTVLIQHENNNIT